jgi:hypothetical protein
MQTQITKKIDFKGKDLFIGLSVLGFRYCFFLK